MFESLRCCDAPEKNRMDGGPNPWVFKLGKKGIEVAVPRCIHLSPNLIVRCAPLGYQQLVGLTLKVVGKFPGKKFG